MLPMAALVSGAIINVILDPLLIFGYFNLPALGIYYKLQTFFFIPLFGLQQVIVPIISYNHAVKKRKPCKPNRTRLSLYLLFLYAAWRDCLLAGS